MTRPVYAQAPLRVSALQTSFLSPSTALRGFSATFTSESRRGHAEECDACK